MVSRAIRASSSVAEGEVFMTPIETDVSDYLEWLEVHNYASTTVSCRARYLGAFTRFAEAAGIEGSEEVTLELLVDYQRHLFDHRKRDGQPLSFGTQAQRLIPVAQLFSWLRRAQRIDANPAADLLMPRPERRLPDATLTALEMAKLLSMPNLAKPLGLRDRAVLEVFYSCGLRRAELINLQLRDVDFDRGTLFVRHGKGAKDRHVPIGERALFWVRLYVDIVRCGFVADEGSEHLFVSSLGTPLCPDWLCRKVRSYLAQAEIDKRGSCHLLRHTTATLMLEGGADIRYVAEMLGHARLETTQRYTRVSIDRLRAVHAATHPASGLGVGMATELCAALPTAAALGLGATR